MLIDEMLVFTQAEHDDLFDGLQTMMEGAMKITSYCAGMAMVEIGRSMRDEDDDFFFDTYWQ